MGEKYEKYFYMLSGTALLLALTACSSGEVKEDKEVAIKKTERF